MHEKLPEGLILGAHLSIRGGIPLVPVRAHKLGLNAVQFFLANPRKWEDNLELSSDIIANFQIELKKAGVKKTVIHTPYLLNLCSNDRTLLQRSRKAFEKLYQAACNLGADYLVVHPGSPRDPRGINLMGDFLSSFRDSKHVRILVENVAGGKIRPLDSVIALKSLFRKAPGIGHCMDTAHLFQAGFDISNSFENAISLYSHMIPPDIIEVVHLNDSLSPAGSGTDRHAWIGRGYIGEKGFLQLFRHPSFRFKPFILETPKKSEKDDLINIEKTVNLWIQAGPRSSEFIREEFGPGKSTGYPKD